MEPSYLDNLILNIFEIQCDKVYFPIVSQIECRRFVKWLHEDGASYEALSNEVAESEKNLGLWRRGLTKRRVGEKMMCRINKPFNDLLESADSVEDSYETIFSNEDSFYDLFESCEEASQPLNEFQQLQNNYKHVWNAKPNQISLIEEVNTDEEFSDNSGDNLNSFIGEEDKFNLKKLLLSSEYKDFINESNQTVISNSIKYNFEKLIRNIVSNLVEDSMNVALREISGSAMEDEFLKSQKVVKKLSSDSFQSCYSTFYDSQCMSGGGDAFKVIRKESCDFDSFEEAIDTTIYHETTTPHISTPILELTNHTQPPQCLYLFGQSLHNNIHRFKLGATSDLQSVKKEASQYNLDLSLVISLDFEDSQSSLSHISSSLRQFKINDFYWYEAEYVNFINSFNEAIKKIQ